jgi:SAM-dependent methyltransferase
MGRNAYRLSTFYLTSLEAGIRAVAGEHHREAAARLLNPLSYPRWMEYDLVINTLGPIDGCRVLDVGSPKLPTLVLARRTRCELYSTDIRDYFIAPTAEFLNKLGHGDRVGRDIHLEVADARRLPYPDSFFDHVFSISVLEHIPDDGDSQAMHELSRVLRPGGSLTLTVPYASSGYVEEWVRGGVYERAGDHSRQTFYQRRYDAERLTARLIGPSGLRLDQMVFFGEPCVPFERYWNRIPMKWKIPLLWAQPFIASAFLKKLRSDQLASACGVALKLTKS